MRQQSMPNQYEMAQHRKEENDRLKKKWNIKEGGAGAAADYDERRKKKIQFRNENILCAIIALMKELDKSGLEFVRKDCEKRIRNWKEEDEFE